MFLLRKKIIFLIQLAFFIFLIICNCQLALAAGPRDIFNNSLNTTGTTAGYTPVPLAGAEKSLTTTIGKLIAEVLSFLGVIFLILMIYGGYVWMKARGNEAEVKRAREMMINALIGLLVVVAAYAISYFVVSTLQSSAFTFIFL